MCHGFFHVALIEAKNGNLNALLRRIDCLDEWCCPISWLLQ
jgi:hypothetical protein